MIAHQVLRLHSRSHVVFDGHIRGMKTARIDVTKIDKSAIYEGKKGKYLDIVLWDKPDQYGNDGYITQDLGKERRERGDKSEFLGNWKESQRREQSSQPENRASDRVQAGGLQTNEDDILF